MGHVMADEESPGAFYRLADGLLITDVADESVILAVDSEKYFSVKGAMRALLDDLRDGMTADAMASAMCDRFDVSREEAARDIASTLPKLVAAGLVVADSAA
jgi:hypothetical protein